MEEERTWKTLKTVGPLIGYTDDIKEKKRVPNGMLASFLNFNISIRQDKINSNKEVEFLKAQVKYILIYDCHGHWHSIKKKINKKIDVFYWKSLCKVWNVFSPATVTNKSLYKESKDESLSMYIIARLWSLIRHIIRKKQRKICK